MTVGRRDVKLSLIEEEQGRQLKGKRWEAFFRAEMANVTELMKIEQIDTSLEK